MAEPSDNTRAVTVEDDRTGMDPVTLRRAFTDHLNYSLGKRTINATGCQRPPSNTKPNGSARFTR